MSALFWWASASKVYEPPLRARGESVAIRGVRGRSPPGFPTCLPPAVGNASTKHAPARIRPPRSRRGAAAISDDDGVMQGHYLGSSPIAEKSGREAIRCGPGTCEAPSLRAIVAFQPVLAKLPDPTSLSMLTTSGGPTTRASASSFRRPRSTAFPRPPHWVHAEQPAAFLERVRSILG